MRSPKRLIAVIITLALAAAVLVALPVELYAGITAYAESTTTLTVTGTVVNIRSGAGTGYSKITTVTKGTVLTSLGTANDGSGAKWYKVNVGGKTGYIIGSFVSPSTTSSSTQTLTVTGSTVYVRSGAGTSNKSLTVVKKGATYKVLGSSKDSSGTVWYKISANGSTGYITSKFVKVSGTSTTTTTKATGQTTATSASVQKLTVTGDVVNVRSGAGTGNKKVTAVKSGATFTVLGSAKDSSGKVWYKITANGVTGYIVSTYVKVSTVTTTTTASATTTTTASTTSGLIITTSSDNMGGAIVTTTTTTTTSGFTGTTLAANVSVKINSGTVNVHSGAGKAYSIMTSLTQGDVVTILSNKLDSDNILWYHISYGAINGYVRASELEAASSVTSTTATTSTAATAATTTTYQDGLIVGESTTSTTTTTIVGQIIEVTTTVNKDTDTRTVKYGTVSCSTTLNVRSGPGTSYSALGQLKNNAQVVIVDTVNGWYKIEYGGGYGYVMDDYIVNVKTGTITISLSFAKPYNYVNVGSTVDVSISLSGYSVSYSSDNSAGASVNANGIVTGYAPGLYKITATAGSASATTEVVVLKAPYTDVQPMTISAEGTNFISQWEGGGTALGSETVFYPYQDVSNYWTVGYGHAITSQESRSWSNEKAVAQFNLDITALLGPGHELTDEKPYLTLEEAQALLWADLNKGPYVTAVSNWAVRNGVRLNQQQFDSLVSFCYNLGPAYWTSDTYYFYLKSAIIAYRSGSDAVPEQIIEGFCRYIKSSGKNLKGLWWRRRNEAEMFITGDYALDRDNKFTLPGNISWS